MSNDRICIVLFPVSFFYTIQFLGDLLFLKILHPWLLTCADLNNFAFPIPNRSNIAPKSSPCSHPLLCWLRRKPWCRGTKGLHQVAHTTALESELGAGMWLEHPKHLLHRLLRKGRRVGVNASSISWALISCLDLRLHHLHDTSKCGKGCEKADMSTVYLPGLSSLLCSEQRPLLLLFLFPWEQTQDKQLVKEQTLAWWAGCLWRQTLKLDPV